MVQEEGPQQDGRMRDGSTKETIETQAEHEWIKKSFVWLQSASNLANDSTYCIFIQYLLSQNVTLELFLNPPDIYVD